MIRPRVRSLRTRTLRFNLKAIRKKFAISKTKLDVRMKGFLKVSKKHVSLKSQ
jgi:hypothetical protein